MYRRVFQLQQYEQARSCPTPGVTARVVAPAPPRFILPWLLNLESFLERRLRIFSSVRYTQRFPIRLATNQQRHRILAPSLAPSRLSPIRVTASTA